MGAGQGEAFITVADDMTQLQARIARLSSSSGQATATFQSLAGIASQTGASLRDTTKLWETMTASLKDAGATNEQILSLTRTLQQIGKIGGSSSEEMANALRQFGQSIASGQVRAEEFNSIIEQMPELGRRMAKGLGISMGQLRQLMLDGKLTAQDALNSIMSQTDAVASEFEKLPRSMQQATSSLEITFQSLVKNINDATGASNTMVRVIDSLNSALQQLMGQSASAAQQISDLTSTAEMFSRRARTWSWLGIDGWSEQNEVLASVSEQAATLVGDMDAVAKASKSAANNKPLNVPVIGNSGESKATTAASKKAAKATDDIAKQIQQLQQTAINSEMAMQGLNREVYINEQVSRLSASATQAQKDAMQSAAGAAFDAQQKQQDLNAAIAADPTRNENKAYQDAANQLDRQLQGNLISQEQYNSQSEQLAVQHQQALANIASQQAVSPQQQAAGDVDPVQQLANENAQKIALIRQYEQARVISSQQADALIAASQTQYEQQRLAAIEQQYRAQSQLNDFLMSTIDAVGQRTTNAITGLITGTQSASDAVRNLASTILDQAVGALVQMGVQAIKNMVIGQTAASASTALAATTGAAMAAAYAPAAALASLASFGANSAPAMAGITSTVGLAQGLALAGARRYGGTTSAGSMYRVNESGEPEMFQTSGGKQYMMPTTSGKVVPAGDVAGGGTGAPVLNIYNYSSASVDAQATQNSDGSWTLEAFVADMNNGGPASQAITANHNVKRTPRGQN
ncbi:tape measure protein [Enterobacter cloacae complex sp. IR5403]|uniref:tape measure protein n=1 Tax=Enterobacter cloacae complex sp. IR5403 TaxID=3412359 RepID=UPI003BA6B872